MTIDIKHKEYLPILTVEKGIRVLIADQDIALLPDEEGISISPGVSASVSLRKVILLTISCNCVFACKRNRKKCLACAFIML